MAGWAASKYRGVLAEFYDGIKEGCPGALVAAPGTFCEGDAGSPNCGTATDPFVRAGATFVRPIDYISIHTYKDVAGQKTRLTEANTYVVNTSIPNGGPSKLIVTEFGISSCADSGVGGSCPLSEDPSPGNRILEYFDKCKALSNCELTFFFTLHDRWTRNLPNNIMCDYGLIRGIDGDGLVAGTPRKRLCTIRTGLNGDPGLTCQDDPSSCSP